MKKLFLLLMFVFPLLAYSQSTSGYHRTNQVLARAIAGLNAQVVPYAQIYVTNTASGAAATIYSDPLLTALIPNSTVTADNAGNYSYYIPLVYCVTENISSPGQGSRTIPNVCVNGSGAANFTPTGIQYAINTASARVATGSDIASLLGGTVSGSGTSQVLTFPGTLTVSKSIISPQINGVVSADDQTGSDLGAKINNAVASCVSQGIVCQILVSASGTISTPPDLPMGFSVSFAPQGQYTLATHWVIYHRGTSYYFNGAHFLYTLDDGLDAIYIGKQTASVVNASGTTITWVSGTNFSHADVGDQIMVDSGAAGPNIYNIAAVISNTQLTVTQTTIAASGAGSVLYLTAETALGNYPGKAPLIRDLNIAANPSTAASSALVTELTSAVTVSGFSASNFVNGYCFQALGAITGNFYDFHCNANKYGLLLDQNHIGTFFGSQANVDRFYGLDIAASNSASGYAFNILGGSGNLLSGLRVEGNLNHTVATLRQIAALGYPGTILQATTNQIQVLDWERNGDGASGATEIALLNASAQNVISGGDFTSIGGTFIGVSAGASTTGNVLRDTGCYLNYTSCYVFVAGSTGQVSNVTGAFTNTPPVLYSVPSILASLGIILNGAYAVGTGNGDAVLSNGNFLWSDTATHNANFKLIGSNSSNQVSIDPSDQGTVFGGSIGNANGTLLPGSLTGFHGSSGTKVQLSDGTGSTGHYAKYASDGSVTDGGASLVLPPIRAGSWSIASSTTVAVTFATAMSATPTSCTATPSASSATTGQPFATVLATTGFTVNVPNSGTLSGTYQCVINNAN